MTTSGGGSLELGFPSSGWNLAPEPAEDKLFSNSSPSCVMPYGGSSFGLMQGCYSGWSVLQHPSKQDPASPRPNFSALISSLHQLPDLHANPPMLPILCRSNDWRRAAPNSLPFESNSEEKAPRKHGLFHYQMGRTLPAVWGNYGELIGMSKMIPKEILNAKALAASKSHSEAERRRRERINTHLGTLRSLIPSTTKTDKASLLAEVVHCIKKLKRQAAEIAQVCPIPTDIDELQVDTDSSLGGDRVLIRASLCCDDRPDLLSDLIRASRDLKLQTVKAEIFMLGGRVKNVILLTRGDGTSCKQEGPSVSSVQEALREVMEKSGLNELSPSNFLSNKRQRMGYHSCSKV
ncbi:hypothetical protein O6H91_13G024400 [Diphasiastrum complanatum]|uniref:Uncharacterized protein n=1 Tax=Diphasiastrum complanatum TaxID=34168 RepID=A0ACC2BSY0_DIPCM|nr:hypothetical protein O6H91_13G024400 [Diphasiastrum complanatum]